MGQEIERKFLVQGEAWRWLGSSEVYAQGYLATNQGCTVRVRRVGDRGYLTIKGPTVGCSRSEYEYAIPATEAAAMLSQLCAKPLIEKTRYKVPVSGLIWEIDEFAGANQGLIVAEVELSHPDQPIALPDWIGSEVTDDPRYYNSNLAQHPYSEW
ncbi:MAG: CYTH domain-containing protein [Aphanocapsa sp. GSE-SYN-MK-11-07L]|jgi:CYTH domain-containing protein|nr:CYTH domain-containing protein [Aphanocapsa sp. GSE-SYN-MK-11-07L]